MGLHAVSRTMPQRLQNVIKKKRNKKKKRLWRKLKVHPSEILSRKFKELRKSVKQLVRSEYKRYLELLSSQLKVLTQNDLGATTQLSRNQNGFLM